jgi:hypothetical protein
MPKAVVKRLIIEVYDDNSRTIRGFGWGPTPTIAFIGSHAQGDRPWLVATEPYSIPEIGRILAAGLDLSMAKYDQQIKDGTVADDDSDNGAG